MKKSEIMKNGQLAKSVTVKNLELQDGDMALINQYTLSPLKPEDVFTFKLLMCDNLIDRDHERFSELAVKDLAPLFLGRTLIKDHSRQSDNQVGRIFDTEVEIDYEQVTDFGQPYTALIAKLYILRTESNEDLIRDIEGGIKKEVSIGASMGRMICNICGTDNRKEYCEHWWGRVYDGVQCYFTLEDPREAYEVSFVAVPAQRDAGVIKSLGMDNPDGTKVDTQKDSDEPETDEVEELELSAKAFDTYLFLETLT